MSSKRKSKKRTRTFKKGNPQALKSALNAVAVRPMTKLSRSLKEMDEYYSIAFVQAADLEAQLFHLATVNKMGMFLHQKQLIADLLPQSVDLAQILLASLKSATESLHRLRKAADGGWPAVRSSCLAKAGKAKASDTFYDTWRNMRDPSP